jgi:hypothetical protein
MNEAYADSTGGKRIDAERSGGVSVNGENGLPEKYIMRKDMHCHVMRERRKNGT